MYNKRLVFWSACIGILFFGMAITTLGSVVPQLKAKFDLDNIAAGTLFSILPFGILIGSLVFGPFCDRYGYRVLLALTCFSMFVGFEGIAYAPSHFALNICIFLFGLGGGAINGATSALVSDISDKEKGANLSLLGVFFAIGALGMPFILGFLQNKFNYESTVSIIGAATFLMGIIYLLVKFPPPKHAGGLPVKKSLLLLKDDLLLLIAFFLFFQSALEGIFNNWTTTYLTDYLHVLPAKALYALSLSVVGMTVMRLLLGSIFRNMSAQKIWTITFSLLLIGLLFLSFGKSYCPAVCGLILIGGGLAAGFPIMLGFVGDRFKELSGTAFSIAFVIALIGNMIINYCMGFIVQRYGVRHLTTVGFVEFFIMMILCIAILNKLNKNHKN
ncbi:MFS transporter [Hanamia caeni]|uniref:MFS transporter n=1 Tax=Hanamia caeni TaxID=2294116 RepID=UPI0018F67C43|nr:MFS transporter [Hanamia caeni]